MVPKKPIFECKDGQFQAIGSFNGQFSSRTLSSSFCMQATIYFGGNGGKLETKERRQRIQHIDDHLLAPYMIYI